MAKKIIDVNLIDRKKLFKKTLIANFCIVFVCIGSILGLLLGNFLSINVKIVLDDAALEKIPSVAYSVNNDGTNSNGRMNAVRNDEMIYTMAANEKTNPLMQIPEKDRTIALSIDFSSNVLVDAVTRDDATVVKNIIDSLVKNTVKQIIPIINIVAKVAVNTVVIEAIDKIKESLLVSGVEDSNLEAELKNLGIDADELMKEAGNIVNELFVENPNTQKIKTDIIVILENIMSNDSEQSKQEVVDNFEKFYDELIVKGTDSEGNFDIFTFIDGILSSVDSFSTSKVTTNFLFGGIKMASTTEAIVTEKLLEFLPADANDTVGLSLRIVGIIIAVIIAAWAYIILKIILKTLFFKNKTVRVGLPCFFGILMFILFVIVPAVLFLIFKSSIPSGTSLGVWSSAFVVTFVTSVILIVNSFFYKRYRRQYKAILYSENTAKSQPQVAVVTEGNGSAVDEVVNDMTPPNIKQ